MDQKTDDHDLIIKIHTIVERLVLDVKDLKDNTVSRIENLEENKASKIDMSLSLKKIEDNADCVHRDFEYRMKKQEIATTKIFTWGSAGLLVLAISEFILARFF